jgi:CelD/BcsL family acetyltransferase involved in cellulose biosynthesis
MLDGRLVEDAAGLEALREAWDDLAVEAAHPFCAPGWALPWLRHAAPPEARLRAVAVLDGDRLAGIAPFVAVRRRGLTVLRLLAADVAHRVEPLARAGSEREVAQAIVAGLARSGADALELDGIAAGSPWPELLREAWPGRPRLVTVMREPAPAVSLAGRSFDEWLGSRSAHFRKRMRQARRRLDESGATIGLADTPESAAEAMSAFFALHRARWERSGGSGVVDAGVERMLRDVAAELDPGTRLRLWVVEAEGRPVGVELLLAAGGEVAAWLGGFEEPWAERQVSVQSLLAALEHAASVGDRRLDLGPGAQPYKLRLADGEEILRTVVLVLPGPHAVRALADAVRRRARREVALHTPEPLKQVVRRLRRTIP